MKSFRFFLVPLLFVAILLSGCSKDSGLQLEEAKSTVSEDGLYAFVDTKAGLVAFKLYEKEMPLTVELFAGLASGQIGSSIEGDKVHFYDGLDFYRVSKGRLAKSGCPLNNGSGDAGFRIPKEVSSLSHTKAGYLTMLLNSNKLVGSQFAITMRDLPYLDNRAVVIGEAIYGLKSVDKLKSGDALKSVSILRYENGTFADYVLEGDFQETLATYTKKLFDDKVNNGLFANITTTKGDILIQLELEKTPMTVANFVGLAEGSIKNDERAPGVPYYDGLKFHRVIADFMIQGGCPQGTGTGDPGYKFPDEFDSSLSFDGPGVLAMANSGPGTNGSQFFITHKDTSWLNGKHTIFGHVIDGQDVVNAIEQGDTIVAIKIIRKGAAAEAFHPTEKSFRKMIKR